jgi:hypothetical protein
MTCRPRPCVVWDMVGTWPTGQRRSRADCCGYLNSGADLGKRSGPAVVEESAVLSHGRGHRSRRQRGSCRDRSAAGSRRAATRQQPSLTSPHEPPRGQPPRAAVSPCDAGVRGGCCPGGSWMACKRSGIESPQLHHRQGFSPASGELRLARLGQQLRSNRHGAGSHQPICRVLLEPIGLPAPQCGRHVPGRVGRPGVVFAVWGSESAGTSIR